MQRYKLAILGVSEVQWNGNGQIVTSNGNVFMYSGMSNVSDPHMEGVGILLNKNIRAALLKWNPISDRIITARVKIKFKKISIVQCYAPTEDAEPTEKEVFYSLLDRTLTDIHRSDIVLMMGDFNTKVRCDNEDIEYIMWKYGLPQRNENGELLIEICGRHGLVIGGTIFPHKACHKVIWVSPAIGGIVQNQIDHICISKYWRKSLLDVHNKRGADVGSDHHMIMGILKIYISRGRKIISDRKKYDVRKIGMPDIRNLLRAQLQESIALM
jgi:hypothetical protein